MTRLPRLRDASPNPFTRELLDAADPDGPSPEVVRRVAGSLGCSAALIAATSSASAGLGAASAGAGVATASAGKLGAPILSESLRWVVIKWLAIGAVSGGALAGGVGAIARDNSQEDLKTSTNALPQLRSQQPSYGQKLGPKPGDVATEREATVDGELPHSDPGLSLRNAEAQVPQLRMKEPVPAVRNVTIPGDESTSQAADAVANEQLKLEVVRIEAIKQALASGNNPHALRLLDDYFRERKLGVLDREALVLKVDVLLALRQHQAAATEARRYLDAYPQDAHSKRLEEVAR